MEIRNVLGFEFIRVGDAYKCTEGIKVTHNKKKFTWDIALKMVHPDFLNAEQSTYLIYVDEQEKPVYVGQYSDTFSDRWLRQGKYFWHSDNIDDKTKELLEGKKSVSVWLSVSPYATSSNGQSLNINKAIEQELIEKLQPTWNKKGKDAKNRKNAIKVLDIMNKLKL